MRVLALVLVAGCAVPTSVVEQELTAEVKRQRLGLIRDSAAELGIHNAALLAGVATSETQLAHCWSEATYACMGPASSSCGGGPIIAGSADGPCANEQGGLGMFQFDAGTYAQTLAQYGDAILTVEGNTAQAVSFVIDKVILDEPDVTDWMSAAAWLDQVPLVAGDPVTEEWARLMACRYNGCCSGSALCTKRAAGYRDNALLQFEEMGAAFWRTADRCRDLPEGGVIDERTACYVAGGEPKYWRREDGGYGDRHEWTVTTDADAPSSFARWLLRPARAGRYRVEAFVAGGAATTAAYDLVHAGATERVVIDQSASDGFVLLGEIELAGDGTEYVQLGDNTGVREQELVFDALRVTSLDGGGGGGDDGGCAAAAGGATGAVALALLLLARRRRR